MFLPEQPKPLKTWASSILAPALTVELARVKPAAWARPQAAMKKAGSETRSVRDMASLSSFWRALLCAEARRDSTLRDLLRQVTRHHAHRLAVARLAQQRHLDLAAL